MNFEKLGDIAHITPGTSPKGSLINSKKLGLPFFQGSKEFKELYPLPERYTEHPVKVAKSGDVLISVRAPVGEVNFAREDCAIGRGVMSVRAKKESEQAFIFYFLKNLKGEWSSLGSTGSVFENLSTVALNNVDIPDGLNREAIGEVLFNLDQKIEVNNSLSKTLEDIAQTIFKSWFIDFDPVKAKMAGETPAGMDAATAALFPDAMEESEIGLIPKGWSWISVGEIASVIDCLHSKKPELLEEGFPYLQLDTISDTGVLRFENAGLISKEDYDKWTSRIEVQGGDCLITNVGRVGAVSQVPDHFKAAIGRNITALRPKDLRLHRSFLIVALLSDFMKKEIKRNTDSGTILEALNVKNIPKLIIPGPSNFVLQEFAKLCDPIQLQLHELHKMNVNLKRIRDSLLPRLISGELKIPEDMLAS
jgi:type I restriction enzyme S subunit